VNRQKACVETGTSKEASAQATFRGGGGLLSNRARISIMISIACRATENPTAKTARLNISSSCRDEVDGHHSILFRRSATSVAEKTQPGCFTKHSSPKVIDDDSSAALNRERYHQ
jgi:hypothetical protein